MKQILLIAAILFSMTVSAQTVKRNGNTFTEVKKTTIPVDSTTVFKYVDSKGMEYPVFKNGKEKLYIWKISKNGNKYRSYLKEEK